MWIVIAVASYFLFAIVALLDKYLLSGPLPSPKTYVFYIGMLGGGVAMLSFLFGFVTFPESSILLLALAAGVMRTFGLLTLFSGLRLFEVSRIVPAFGGILPIFTFLFTVMLTNERGLFLPLNFAAFSFLLAGTIGITFTRDRSVTVKSLMYATGAAFFGAVSFFLSKFVYEAEPFLSGLTWLLVGAFVTSLVFLGSKSVQKDVFALFRQPKDGTHIAKNFPWRLFLGNQTGGASAVFLQNLAIALVPVGLFPFVQVMGGVEYLFLFLFAIVLSRQFPSMFKEKVSRSVIFQKVVSILLISGGLLLLAL